MEQRDMVMFSKFPKKLCSGLMYAFVIYTLQMILNGGWKRAQRFKCCPLALGSVPYITATEWNWPKCKGMFTMFERKISSTLMSLNYQYECLFSSSLQVRRACLAKWKVLDNEGAPSCGEEVPQVPYPRPPVPPHISHFLIKYIKADPYSTLDNPSSK